MERATAPTIVGASAWMISVIGAGAGFASAAVTTLVGSDGPGCAGGWLTVGTVPAPGSVSGPVTGSATGAAGLVNGWSIGLIGPAVGARTGTSGTRIVCSTGASGATIG